MDAVVRLEHVYHRMHSNSPTLVYKHEQLRSNNGVPIWLQAIDRRQREVSL